MPERKIKFGSFPTPEGGTRVVTPTTMGFLEPDGGRIPFRRVRQFDATGELQGVYLVDEMGVRFQDLPDVADDTELLAKLAEQNS